MAQTGYDELMALTESRYKLSVITAKRAAQLKAGLPSVLAPENYPPTRNTVTIAMHELITTEGVAWGTDLPDEEDLIQFAKQEKRDKERFSRESEKAQSNF